MTLFLNTATKSGKASEMPNKFRCAYCHRVYARESWYHKHELVCEKKAKFEQMHNMDFIRAHSLYSHWLRRNRWLVHGKEVSGKQFIDDTRYYNEFTVLVKFTIDNWVISSMQYLDYLIDHRIPMPKWRLTETVHAYRDYIRRNEDPMAQVKITSEAIKKWCDKHEIKDHREFFSKVGPGTALQMVTANQISPWVLFGYSRAVTDLLARMNGDWICSVNEFLNNAYWINRLKNSADIKNAVQTECERIFLDE